MLLEISTALNLGVTIRLHIVRCVSGTDLISLLNHPVVVLLLLVGGDHLQKSLRLFCFKADKDEM